MSTLTDKIKNVARRYDELTQQMAEPEVSPTMRSTNWRGRSIRELSSLPALRRGRTGLETRLLEDDRNQELAALGAMNRGRRDSLEQRMKLLLPPRIRTTTRT